MARKDRKSAYEDKDLTDAKWMVEGVIGGDYDLEDILKEYGGGAAAPLQKPAEEEPAVGEETAETPAEEPAPAGETPAEESAAAEEPPAETPEEPEPAEEPAEARPKRVLVPGRFAAPEPEVQEEPEEEEEGEEPPPPPPPSPPTVKAPSSWRPPRGVSSTPITPPRPCPPPRSPRS